VAIGGSGNTVFVWTRRDGSAAKCCERIQARARSAAGVLSPVQTLSKAGQNARHPQVAIDDRGETIFTWELQYAIDDPFYSYGGLNYIQARARSAAGTLRSVRTLTASDSSEFGKDPQVAVASGGRAAFVWTLTSFGRFGAETYGIQGRARSAAGQLAPTQTLTEASYDTAVNPQVAIDKSGRAVFVWNLLYGTSSGPNSRVQARTRSASSVLGPVVTLTASGHDASLPQVAENDAGNAFITWERPDNKNWRVSAVAGP
jgi:hypothetical protein